MHCFITTFGVEDEGRSFLRYDGNYTVPLVFPAVDIWDVTPYSVVGSRPKDPSTP
jgi:hypothetical protein